METLESPSPVITASELLMLFIINWLLFIIYAIQAGYSFYLLTTFFSNWWCLSNKRSARKYSMFGIVTLLMILFICLLVTMFLGVRYNYLQYVRSNWTLNLSYLLLGSICGMNFWLLFIIKYYRNHILYREGVLTKWSG